VLGYCLNRIFLAIESRVLAWPGRHPAAEELNHAEVAGSAERES
jgi:hypothetical protein